MSSRRLVDPEILPLIEQFPGFTFSADALPAMREMMNAMGAAQRPPVPPEVKVGTRTIPGPAGAPEVAVIVSAPRAPGEGRPCILHIHGGGYVMGSAEGSSAADAAYAAGLGAVVVSVDYRLAPETPFPGPVEDCYAALAWMVREAPALGVDPARIAISGESAGGGLAAALALLARDRGEHRIAFQHLVFPMLDDRTVTRTDVSPLLGEFVWTPENNRFGWTSLLGAAPGGADVSPYAAPARARDLAGLPPAWIACGALDLFLDENLDYARRLITAGVPTELHVWPGCPHAFMLAAEAAVSRTFARESMAALGRALGV